MNRKDYIDSIKSVFISMLTKAAIRVLVTRLPFLAWGPIAPVVAFVVEKIITKAAKEAEIGVYFAYVDMRVSSQGREFTEKALEYYKNKTPETEKAVIDSFTRFACYTL